MVKENVKKPKKKSLKTSFEYIQNLLSQYLVTTEAEAEVTEDNHYAKAEDLVLLQKALHELHPADIADLLESLPLKERLLLWKLVKSDHDGDVLLEVSDSVRETLLDDMDDHEILAAAKEMDADELADLAIELPTDVLSELMASLDAQERERVKSALSYEDDQVGALMDFKVVSIREDITLEVVLRYLRRLKTLPGHTDKIFVVDSEAILTGILPIKRLLVNDPDKLVNEIMLDDPIAFYPDGDAYSAAQAFERYNLISAPVIDHQGKLLGRLTIDEMVDVIREESETEMLNMAGLREEEDIFASVWRSLRNRWAWLAVNLVTAFIASRVIGLFDGTIEKLVALAALMPIVAGIGGNSGNQTITMIVRAMALNQITTAQTFRLLLKELSVSLINGLVWGSVIGLVAFYLYNNWALGLVMTLAMTLNLLLAAMMGVIIPMTMVRFGRDPALGSSVMITAVTDSGGFFIFLGLATLFIHLKILSIAI